ncbi:MAG: PIG-L deacetylase family protein [Actinomycetota bacterium]
MQFRTALAVFAHPDDGEFGFAGTIAKWAKEGTEVHYVCITDGSAGSNERGVTREELRPIREREQRAACEVLGVRECHFLGFVDGQLELDMNLRRAVTRVVRDIRPDVIVGTDPSRLWNRDRTYINHLDHRIAGEVVLTTAMPDAPSRPQFPELLEEGFEPFEVPAVWFSAEDGDTVVDISDTIDAKIRALGCHESQLGAYPDWQELIRRMGKERGAPAGVEYAECFKTFNLKNE